MTGWDFIIRPAKNRISSLIPVRKRAGSRQPINPFHPGYQGYGMTARKILASPRSIRHCLEDKASTPIVCPLH